jgi:spore germination protein YaaH
MRKLFLLVSILSGFLFLAPAFASAGTFEVSGWLPYWRGATSTNDVMPHLSELTEVNPFVYSLRNDGTFLDNAGIGQPPWSDLIAAAKAQKVRVIPTIMTGDGSLVHSLLSNSTKRIALEVRIANFVKQNNFDGIEIDFEGKLAEDKDNFSTFLKGLYARMGNKWVMCDIEARTPLSSKYYGTQVPANAGQYANDFTQINKYCDRVKFMTYDQQGDDMQLTAQAASSSELYAPVADPAWVTKVINLAKQSINPNKIMIGIPTYGYEYDVTAYAGNQYVYDIMWTFNPLYATQISQQYNVAPTRAPWGEMNLSYFTSAATSSAPLSSNAFLANAAAVAASTYASSTNSHVDFRYLVWPDAQSIAGKIALAKSLGVRGVAIFKLDGGEDPGIWNVLQGVKK